MRVSVSGLECVREAGLWGEREIILSEHMWMNSIDDNSAAVGVTEGVSLAALNFLNGRKRLNLILT